MKPPPENGEPVIAVTEPPATGCAARSATASAIPPAPVGPQVGDKVGFIQLPSKAAPRSTEKPEPARSNFLRHAPALDLAADVLIFHAVEVTIAISAAVSRATRVARKRPEAGRGGSPSRTEPSRPAAAGRSYRARNRRNHFRQAADCRARTCRATQTQTVPIDRRFDGVERLREREPGD